MDFILEHEVLVIVLLHAAAFAAVLVLCSVRDGFGGDAVVTALMAAAVCFGVLLVCVLISNILGFIKQPWGMAATLIIPFAAAVKTGLARESESREEPTPPAAPVTRVTPVIPVAAATRTVFAAAPGPSLSTACATFFAAVSKFQEINGDTFTGSTATRRTWTAPESWPLFWAPRACASSPSEIVSSMKWKSDAGTVSACSPFWPE